MNKTFITRMHNEFSFQILTNISELNHGLYRSITTLKDQSTDIIREILDKHGLMGRFTFSNIADFKEARDMLCDAGYEEVEE